MKYIKLSFFFLGILAFLGLGFSGCQGTAGPTKRWMESEGKIRILATTAQIGDLAAKVGGDRVDVLVLIRGDLNPHSYELVKGDGEKLARADLILSNGLGLEHGASLSAALKESPHRVALGEWIAEKYPEKILMAKGVIDPHIWMDVSLWEKGVDPIVEHLVALDPEGAFGYKERGEALKAEMGQVHEAIKKLLQQVPQERRYLVTSHDAFHYFTRSYLSEPGEKNWADRFAAPEGLAPDGQLNPIDLQGILSFMQERGVHVIFPESNVHPDSIRKIASAGKEMGFLIRVCESPLYGDSTSGLFYLEAMRHNGELIYEELIR